MVPNEGKWNIGDQIQIGLKFFEVFAPHMQDLGAFIEDVDDCKNTHQYPWKHPRWKQKNIS